MPYGLRYQRFRNEAKPLSASSATPGEARRALKRVITCGTGTGRTGRKQRLLWTGKRFLLSVDSSDVVTSGFFTVCGQRFWQQEPCLRVWRQGRGLCLEFAHGIRIISQDVETEWQTNWVRERGVFMQCQCSVTEGGAWTKRNLNVQGDSWQNGPTVWDKSLRTTRSPFPCSQWTLSLEPLTLKLKTASHIKVRVGLRAGDRYSRHHDSILRRWVQYNLADWITDRGNNCHVSANGKTETPVK